MPTLILHRHWYRQALYDVNQSLLSFSESLQGRRKMILSRSVYLIAMLILGNAHCSIWSNSSLSFLSFIFLFQKHGAKSHSLKIFLHLLILPSLLSPFSCLYWKQQYLYLYQIIQFITSPNGSSVQHAEYDLFSLSLVSDL